MIVTGLPPRAFSERFQAALAHINAGRLDAAAKIVSALQRVAPDDAAVLQLDATIALRAGEHARALRVIQRSLQLRPRHPPSLLIAARAARAAQAWDLAEAALHEALAVAPGLAEPAFLLCWTLLDRGAASLPAVITQVGARFPAHAAEWQELGSAMLRAGRADLALTAFGYATDAEPSRAQAQFGHGLALRAASRMEEAAAALRAAVALDAEAGAAWFALGLTCQDLHDEAGAAVAYEAALRALPDLAEAAVNLGIARQRLGDMDAALAAYGRAVRIRPDCFARIAQAVTASATGLLWLDLEAFRRSLTA